MIKKTAIIILNWNSYQYTYNCLTSLKNLNGSAPDFILVDNGSIDGSGQKLRNEFASLIYLPQSANLGFAEGNNVGIGYAIAKGYQYVLMLNNDVFVDPDFLMQLEKYMDQHPNVGAIQPKIFFNDDRSKIWNGGSHYLSFLGWTYTKNYQRSEGKKQRIIHEVDWITGCAFFIRSSVLERTGLLNKAFFAYFEDVDLSFRIRSLGYKLIFHPNSIIYHIGGIAHKGKGTKGGYTNPNVHFLNRRNHFWILKIWNSWYHWPLSSLIYFCYSFSMVLYFLFRFRINKLNATCRGIVHGIMKNPFSTLESNRS